MVWRLAPVKHKADGNDLVQILYELLHLLVQFTTLLTRGRLRDGVNLVFADALLGQSSLQAERVYQREDSVTNGDGIFLVIAGPR